MCAGGLPVANETNAEDTVRAALKIRDFMLSEKKKENQKENFSLKSESVAIQVQ